MVEERTQTSKLFVTSSARMYVCFVDIFVPFSAAFWYRSFFVRPLLPSIVQSFSSDKISDMSPKSILIFYLSKRSNLFSRLQKLYREKHVLHSNLYERLLKSHAVSNILFQKFNGWFYEKDKCLISANWHPFEESFTRYCKSHIDHQSFQITPRIEPSTRITIKLHIQRWEKIDSE